METPAIAVKAERIGSTAASRKATPPALSKFLQRYFYFVMSLLLAAIVVSGFQRTVNANLFHPAIPRPLILWFHAAVFATWILVFIAQSALVRVRKVSWHRLFGWFGAGLAAVMVPLGVTTAIVMARFDTFRLHQTGADAFLSVPFYDMLTFGTLVGLAILWRKRPEFHRRLIFIATCGLMDAALARFDFIFDNNLFYPCIDLIILLGVARDLFVEKRVHKVYLYALPLLIVVQSLSLYMWRHNPAWWQGITRVIMG
jgi:FtsH-binding integral membrane protein